MKKNSLLSLITLLGLSITLLFADSAAEIQDKHYRALLQELQDYMKSNPEAADLKEARSSAIDAAFALEDPVIVDLFLADFEEAVAKDPVEDNEVLQAGMLLSRFAQQHGRRDVQENLAAEFRALAGSTGNVQYKQAVAMIESALKMPGIGDQPELSGMDLNGREISLADYKGKVVLLDFWATWCPPCVAEVPNLVKLYETYAEEGFEIIGISADQSKIPLETFVGLNKMTWPNLFDGEQAKSIGDQFGVTKYPTTILLDKKGTVIAIDLRGDSLEKKLAAIFGE